MKCHSEKTCTLNFTNCRKGKCTHDEYEFSFSSTRNRKKKIKAFPYTINKQYFVDGKNKLKQVILHEIIE